MIELAKIRLEDWAAMTGQDPAVVRREAAEFAMKCPPGPPRRIGGLLRVLQMRTWAVTDQDVADMHRLFGQLLGGRLVPKTDQEFKDCHFLVDCWDAICWRGVVLHPGGEERFRTALTRVLRREYELAAEAPAEAAEEVRESAAERHRKREHRRRYGRRRKAERAGGSGVWARVASDFDGCRALVGAIDEAFA